MNTYENLEAAKWRVIVSINPTPKTGEQYYAELSKVNSHGQLYGTKYYKYYWSAEEAFEQMYIFAMREGMVLTEEQLKENGFYESYVDPSHMRVSENDKYEEYETKGEEDG